MGVSFLSLLPESLGGKDWCSGWWYCLSYKAEDIREGSQEVDRPGWALKRVLEVQDGWDWEGAYSTVAWREQCAFLGAGGCAWGESGGYLHKFGVFSLLFTS